MKITFYLSSLDISRLTYRAGGVASIVNYYTQSNTIACIPLTLRLVQSIQNLMILQSDSGEVFIADSYAQTLMCSQSYLKCE